MTARRRMAVLAAMAILLTGAVGAVATYSLYRAALAHHREFLTAVVRTEQTLATQVFRDELEEVGGDTAAAIRGSLEQLRHASRDFVGFGATGEFTLGRQVGDTVRFEIGIRGDSARVPPPVLLPSDRATPMQKALRGGTGVSVETDYAGTRVLAAYGPIPGTGLGVVAKIDLWEIRWPHLRAALAAVFAGVALLLLAVYAGKDLARSLLAEVEEREAAHLALLQGFPGVVFRAVLGGDGVWTLQVLEGAVEEVTGAQSEGLRTEIGAWRALVHEEDREKFDDFWERCARGEEPGGPADYRTVRPHGAVGWVRVHAGLQRGWKLAGVPSAAVSGVVLDVTSEREALEVRHRAEAEMQALVRHLPRAAVHILDPEFRYLYSGGEALADVGLSHEALVGKRVRDVLGPELGDAVEARYARVLEGSTEHFEGTFGGLHFVVTATPLRGPDGRVDRILALSLDVTEERRREAEVAATEARFEAFMYASPAVAWIKDGQGRHVWVNRAWEDVFDLRDAAWRSMTDAELFPAALAEEIRRHDEQVLREHLPLAVVEEAGEREGKRRAWQVVKFPLKGASGEDLVGGVAVDITRERQAEAALRESNHRLRLAVKAGGHGLWDLDLRTGAARINEAYATMIGYDPADFVETNAAWRDRLHPDDRDRVYGEYEAYVAGERDVYRVEFRSGTADGGWRWILSQGEIVERDTQGIPIRMMGTHTDIQPLKDAEAALRESEERFRSAVEASPVAVFIHVQGCFVYVNPAALALFGAARPEQLLGRPVLERHAAHNRDAIAERIRSLHEAREPTPARLEEVIRLDGSTAHAEFRGVPFRYQGQDAGLVFAYDLSERLAAADRIREQMEELRRWQAVMLDREDRVQELKREVNELCRRAGQPPRYASQLGERAQEGTP